MTRAEINNNIRYNENLISSYQKSIRTLNSQIQELSSLKQKFQFFQNDFRSREDSRATHLVNNLADKLYLRFVSSYVIGMQGIMMGSEYRRAYNGLTEAIQKIDRKINQLRNEANSYESKIAYRKNRNTYWKKQLKYAK